MEPAKWYRRWKAKNWVTFVEEEGGKRTRAWVMRDNVVRKRRLAPYRNVSLEARFGWCYID